MSVGHVARLLETTGIATVVITVAAFRDRLAAMSLPRVVITPYLMGRPLGIPGNTDQQRATLREALNLLEHATQAQVVHVA